LIDTQDAFSGSARRRGRAWRDSTAGTARPGRRLPLMASTYTCSSPTSGLLSYDMDGRERWRLPLGPFNNLYGMGASPVLVDDLVVLVCDQNIESFIVAVGQRDGRVR